MNLSDPRVNRSRRALLDAGIELFLQNPNASLTDVAKHASVGRATLYRHFETRDQLIQALAEESLEITESLVKPLRERNLEGREAIEAILFAIMPVADRYHFLLNLWNIAENDRTVMRIYLRQLNELAELVEQGKAQGSINPLFSTAWLVTVIDSMIYAGWWTIKSEQADAKSVAGLTVATLFGGIAA